MTDQDLSSQSSCTCGARPGRNHDPECQYVADVLAQEAERAARRSS
jgi:hypothetical protein